jgi:hypothetical protein
LVKVHRVPSSWPSHMTLRFANEKWILKFTEVFGLAFNAYIFVVSNRSLIDSLLLPPELLLRYKLCYVPFRLNISAFVVNFRQSAFRNCATGSLRIQLYRQPAQVWPVKIIVKKNLLWLCVERNVLFWRLRKINCIYWPDEVISFEIV